MLSALLSPVQSPAGSSSRRERERERGRKSARERETETDRHPSLCLNYGLKVALRSGLRDASHKLVCFRGRQTICRQTEEDF